jgi:hypothetical protein
MTQSSGGSTKRAAYGAAVERYVCNRYGLDADHSRHADAKYPSTGKPVEIKAAQRTKSDGRGGEKEGEFYLFEHRHRWIRRQDGYYVFAVYRPKGSGVSVLKTKRIHSSRLPRLSWVESGN